MTSRFDEEYARLTAEFPPRPIRSAEEARLVETRVARLMASEKLSEAEKDYLDVLSSELAEWEEEHDEIPDVNGVALIRFLIDERGLRQKDLVPIFGTESIASEVLAERRALQRKHIQALAHFFRVPSSAFFPRPGTRSLTAKFTRREPRVDYDDEQATRLSVAFDSWASTVVDYARNVMPIDVTIVDARSSTSEKVKTAKRENVVLYTVKTASASLMRLTEIGQMVLLRSKEFGVATQTKLLERVSFFLLGQSQSAAGLPNHERIVVDRDRIELMHFNTGSIVHAATIPITVGTA